MMMKRFLKYITFLLILVGLIFLYGFSTKRNQQKLVSAINIEFQESEAHFLTHAMVNKLLIQNNETVKNKTKSVIDLYSLENSVTKNPYVETAAVFLTIDGSLKSIIKQRTPIARIIANNDAYYVDKQGVKVPLSENYSARVLLVSGVKNREEVGEIMPLITYIKNDNFLSKEIVGINKFDDDAYQFAVRSGDYKIDFGKIERMVVKFNKLKAFYNITFKNQTIQNYKTINVKYHNQVVCTK